MKNMTTTVYKSLLLIIFKNYTILTTILNNLYIKYYTNVGFFILKLLTMNTYETE